MESSYTLVTIVVMDSPRWLVCCRMKKGELSLDQYDDSLHSRGSFPGGPGSRHGSGGVGFGVGLGGPVVGGMPSPSPAPPPVAPWGSGLGGLGKTGLEIGQHVVVPGGIWMPTPRATGLGGGTFSPSSSASTTGGGEDGGRGGRGRGGGTGGRGSGSVDGGSGQAGGFFGSDEPRCDRCNNTDAKNRAQVRFVFTDGRLSEGEEVQAGERGGGVLLVRYFLFRKAEGGTFEVRFFTSATTVVGSGMVDVECV